MSRLRSFCFVSETGRKDRPIQDPSVRYRCFHPAEILLSNGSFSTVYSGQNFFDNPSLDYDVYVFHRPSTARRNFHEIISYLERNDKILIADYDDLIFGDVDAALESSAVKNGTLTIDAAVRAFSANLEALRRFTKVTVSTAALAAEVALSNVGARVEVVPNVVPSSLLKVHDELGTPRRVRPSMTIGYFAGTKSHDRDFPVVEAALHRVLLENPKSSLLLLGPVAVPRSIAALPNVTVGGPVNYWRLPGVMTMCETVIAPLEISRFNMCKSRVKFLEAALAGCRLVATPIPDMEEQEGRLIAARTANEWYENLSTPVDQCSLQSLRQKNYEYLNNVCNVDGLLKMVEAA